MVVGGLANEFSVAGAANSGWTPGGGVGALRPAGTDSTGRRVFTPLFDRTMTWIFFPDSARTAAAIEALSAVLCHVVAETFFSLKVSAPDFAVTPVGRLRAGRLATPASLTTTRVTLFAVASDAFAVTAPSAAGASASRNSAPAREHT